MIIGSGITRLELEPVELVGVSPRDRLALVQLDAAVFVAGFGGRADVSVRRDDWREFVARTAALAAGAPAAAEIVGVAPSSFRLRLAPPDADGFVQVDGSLGGAHWARYRPLPVVLHFSFELEPDRVAAVAAALGALVPPA